MDVGSACLLHVRCRRKTFTFAISSSDELLYLKLNKTWQHLHDKHLKNITVIIYLIFVQRMKHRMKITREHWEYDFTTTLRTRWQ